MDESMAMNTPISHISNVGFTHNPTIQASVRHSMRWFRYDKITLERIDQLTCLLNHRADLAWFGVIVIKQLVFLWGFQPQRY